MAQQLHELLAVANNLEQQANKVRSELIATFEKKTHLFAEKRTTFTPLAEGAPEVVESQSNIQTNVNQELEWVGKPLAKAIDVDYFIAEANTVARADVILEDEKGTVLLTSVPATALLELEKRLGEIHALALAIPTLDPAKSFKLDTTRDLYQAREVVKDRTKKVPKVLVKYEATKEHPAQTDVYHEDVPVGKIREEEWSGMITPTEKSAMLGRIDLLIRAVRSARSRANSLDVAPVQRIGAKLLAYAFEGK